MGANRAARRVLAGACLVVTTSCSFNVDYDLGADGGSFDGAPGADSAGSDAGCVSGNRITAHSGTQHRADLGGEICNPTSALVVDEAVAGLDKPQDSSTFDLIPGETVSACLELDLGQVETWTSIRVRAGSVAQACSTACEGEGCIDNHYMRVYSTTEPGGAYAIVADSSALDPDALTDHDFVPIEPARYLIVCRGGGGFATADMVIDSVSAVCP